MGNTAQQVPSLALPHAVSASHSSSRCLCLSFCITLSHPVSRCLCLSFFLSLSLPLVLHYAASSCLTLSLPLILPLVVSASRSALHFLYFSLCLSQHLSAFDIVLTIFWQAVMALTVSPASYSTTADLQNGCQGVMTEQEFLLRWHMAFALEPTRSLQTLQRFLVECGVTGAEFEQATSLCYCPVYVFQPVLLPSICALCSSLLTAIMCVCIDRLSVRIGHLFLCIDHLFRYALAMCCFVLSTFVYCSHGLAI